MILNVVGRLILFVLSAIVGGLVGCFMGSIMGPMTMFKKFGGNITPKPTPQKQNADQI